ncbi:probable 39S ribosomal protein L24, mitochondrial [Pollicipes pollicipes]|uniref:probable 39S ribosomal protein L24, mitochondrial n=1 Tax=Pollicipes pollicipes TaxID=41117 RepID=UPI0018859CCC|nr:probable 39S ribosomal protein L24, mitochondrial [Pollicipes pollicipes]
MRITQALMSQVGKMTKLYSNLPESYIKRAMEKGRVGWRTPKAVQYQPKEIKKKHYRFTMNRPWTEEFSRQNRVTRKKVYVKPILNWNYFRGDVVEVLVGKDKGKIGTVIQVIEERNWVVVEGLNTHYRRVGRTSEFPGTLITSEAPLLVDDQVSLLDPADNTPCSIEWRFTEGGERVRVSTRSGRIIPMPTQAQETHDYKTADTYRENAKDTTADDLTIISFQPKLKTFEMDVMEGVGIEPGPPPADTHWY